MKRVLIVAVLGLAGCASTPATVTTPSNGTTFTVDANYQAVLKNIAAGTRECAAVQLLPFGQQINDVQHYPDLREGRITLGASGVGTQIIQVIDVKEQGAGAAVTVYTKYSASRDAFVANAKRWASGNMSCKD